MNKNVHCAWGFFIVSNVFVLKACFDETTTNKYWRLKKIHTVLCVNKLYIANSRIL